VQPDFAAAQVAQARSRFLVPVGHGPTMAERVMVGGPMGAPWFEALRPLCEQVRLVAGGDEAADRILFYLARWCQKRAGELEPDAGRFGRSELEEVASRIADNLEADGPWVEGVVGGVAAEWSRLERVLLASARSRVPGAAAEFADEALQRIAEVLLTGTPPSLAAERLAEGPAGPSNEYVFNAPFANWARRVLINLIVDEKRKQARAREGPAPPPRKELGALDADALRTARASLPALLEAVRRLPPAQRSAIAASLCRAQLDELARESLQELAPDLLQVGGGRIFESDSEIAEHLGTTPRRLAANRSIARRKLAERDARWELLLDALLPHATTRPSAPSEEAVVARGTEGQNG
jgi:DNA-directed RNA polymerase specialized sigma24 family protein